jgi:hypothetical protein
MKSNFKVVRKSGDNCVGFVCNEFDKKNLFIKENKSDLDNLFKKV